MQAFFRSLKDENPRLRLNGSVQKLDPQPSVVRGYKLLRYQPAEAHKWTAFGDGIITGF